MSTKTLLILLASLIIMPPLAKADVFLVAKFYQNGTEYQTLKVEPSSVYLVQNSPNTDLFKVDGYRAILGEGQGCTVDQLTNTTIPQDGKAYILMLQSSGCDLVTKVENAKSIGFNALLLFQVDFSHTDILEKNKVDLPVVALDSSASSALMKSFDNIHNTTQKNYMDISFGIDNSTTPSLWEFTLIVVIILLAISFTTSVIMHCHLYRLRRQRMNDQRNGNFELNRRNRLSVLSKVTLNTSFPIKVYKGKIKKNPDDSLAAKLQPLDLDASQDKITTTNDGRKEDKRSVASSSTSSNGLDTCAICIEEFSVGDKYRQLPCNHRFHVNCIDPWLTTKNAVCPLCKFSLSEMEINDLDRENSASPSLAQLFFNSSHGSNGGNDYDVEALDRSLTSRLWFFNRGTLRSFGRRAPSPTETVNPSRQDEQASTMAQIDNNDDIILPIISTNSLASQNTLQRLSEEHTSVQATSLTHLEEDLLSQLKPVDEAASHSVT